jgi:hypothetical protein
MDGLRLQYLLRALGSIVIPALGASLGAQQQEECPGCINSPRIRSLWVPGLTRDSQLPGSTDEWHRGPGDIWYFAPSDGQVTISGGAEAGGSFGLDGPSVHFNVSVGVSYSPSSNTVWVVSEFELVRESGVCLGTYPSCEAQTGCRTRISAKIRAVGRFAASDWGYIWDDAGRHDVSPNAGTDSANVSAQRIVACTDRNQQVLVRMKGKAWWFTWDFLRYSFRCTGCPGAV